MPRTRTYDARSSTGRIKYYGIWYDNLYHSVGQAGSCTDEAQGWGKDNAFATHTLLAERTAFTGSSGGMFPITWEAHPAEGCTDPPDPRGKAPVRNLTALALDGAAATNPQRPAINLPAVLGEAGDLPSMLADIPRLIAARGFGLLARAGRHAGPKTPPADLARALKLRDSLPGAVRRAAAEAGNQHLAWQFGWKPLIGDLVRMCGLQTAIAQQLGWLLRLQQGRSIRRRMLLPTTRSASASGTSLLHSSKGTFIYGRYTDVFEVKEWLTTRWAPTPFITDLIIPSDPEGMIALAARLATGLTRMGLAQAAWELLPWSWLVDWWARFGTMLGAVGNSLALRLVSCCYMRTSQGTRYYSYSTVPSWLSQEGGATVFRRIYRERTLLGSYLANAFVADSTLPLLSGRQAGILAALASQKQGRGYRR